MRRPRGHDFAVQCRVGIASTHTSIWAAKRVIQARGDGTILEWNKATKQFEPCGGGARCPLGVHQQGR